MNKIKLTGHSNFAKSDITPNANDYILENKLGALTRGERRKK